MRRKLDRSLKTRHILMIALGSAIGTGLFFSSGKSIQLAGPSILLSYIIGGTIMYFIIRALGEMAVFDPNPGSFSYYAHKYVNGYAGFIAGWNYWFNYIIVSMIELTATTMFLDFWFPQATHWVTILCVLIFFTVINLMNVKFFGEFEFWFAGIKIITIIAMIILGLYLIISNNSNANSHINIHNLWHYGGFFGGGMKGFLFSFVVVIFSFGGTELIGIAAGEASNPHKNIPLAINGIVFRILIFYLATLGIIMYLYPWIKISPNLSPFVDVFNKIGISQAAIIMNIVAITAALSSFNSGIYSTARMLYSLSLQRNAPQSLTKLRKNGTPYLAVAYSLFFIFIIVVLDYFYPKTIFNTLLALATVAAIINWTMILITHIFFRKSTLDKTNYKMPFYPFSTIIALLFVIGVVIVMTQMDKQMRLAIYIAPIWLVILSLAYWAKIKLRPCLRSNYEKN